MTTDRIKLLEKFLIALGITLFCSSLLYAAYLDSFRPRSRNDALGFVVKDKLYTGVHYVTEAESTIMSLVLPAGLGLATIGAAIRRRRILNSEKSE